MPGKQEIEFVIKPDGTVEERVVGVNGPECEQITASIEDALGEVTKRERTADYYDKQTERSDDNVWTNAS
jgi:hypothetical protein